VAKVFIFIVIASDWNFILNINNKSIPNFAAEPNTNVSLDWSEIVKIVGLAGIISGSLSAFLTHHFSIKKIEKEMQIKGK